MQDDITPVAPSTLDSLTIIKKGRGRPKGSKNKPKILEEISEDLQNNLAEIDEKDIEDTEPIIVTPFDIDSKDPNCVLCTAYLLCRKARKRLNVVCERFENNFRELEDAEPVEETNDIPVMFQAMDTTEVCVDCPRSILHIHEEDSHNDTEPCETTNKICKCSVVNVVK